MTVSSSPSVPGPCRPSATSGGPVADPAAPGAAADSVPAPDAPATSVPARATPVTRPLRPYVSELVLTAFTRHRRTGLRLGALTLLAGRSGSGKSSALRAYEALARLAGGAELGEVFREPEALVPEGA